MCNRHMLRHTWALSMTDAGKCSPAENLARTSFKYGLKMTALQVRYRWRRKAPGVDEAGVVSIEKRKAEGRHSRQSSSW